MALTIDNFRNKNIPKIFFTSVVNHHLWFIFQALEYQSIICVINIIYLNCIVQWYPELITQENLWKEKTTFENQFIKTVFMEFESTVKTVNKRVFLNTCERIWTCVNKFAHTFWQEIFSQPSDSQLVYKFEPRSSKSLLLPGSQSSHLNTICNCC